jgi:hypothetical protein
VGLVPLSEGSGIDLDDSGAGQGVVTGFETKGTELAVAATGADKMNTLCANTGVGRLAALLESPEAMLDMTREAIGLCIPLLAVVCALRTGRGTLVARVS